MTRLILIRHGETRWNLQKKYQGHANPGLSATGKKHVRALAARIKDLGIDGLYTSPLKRARQTAAILSAKTGFKPHPDARIKELNFGNWEGKTAAELIAQNDKNFRSWLEGQWKTPKGGESLAELNRRVRAFLKDCVKKHKGKKIAIVSHGGPLRMMILLALGLGAQAFFSFGLEPATFLILNLDDFSRSQIGRLRALQG